MFKRILVISDNVELCSKFYQIFARKNYEIELFEIAISPVSDLTKFKDFLNRDISVYNLKNNNDVNVIIKTFDLVFSIHSKQLFPPRMVSSLKCINIHPGYNPINRGWFPQVFSILNNIEIGATIHEIDNELDHGSIIDRAFVDKEVYDTSLTLYNKILKKEIYLLELNLDAIVFNTYKTICPENKGNLFLKRDYDKLLELDLEEELNMKTCIDKLRALTHGEYNNAYFVDKKTGKKVFVSITLKLDE